MPLAFVDRCSWSSVMSTFLVPDLFYRREISLSLNSCAYIVCQKATVTCRKSGKQLNSVQSVSQYTGPVVLKGVLKTEIQLACIFVEYFGQLYGQEFIVYNVHRLVETLDQISGFPLENFLGKLTTMIRRPLNPLAQVICRLS